MMSVHIHEITQVYRIGTRPKKEEIIYQWKITSKERTGATRSALKVLRILRFLHKIQDQTEKSYNNQGKRRPVNI